MFRNLRVGVKIACGFGTVIVLLLITAYMGYSSLAVVVDRVDKVGDANRLIKGIQQARQNEKNFMLRKDDTYMANLHEISKEIMAQAKVTRKKFTDKINTDQMDTLIQKVTDYTADADAYADMETQRDQAMEEMRTQAREALKQLEDIRADQKKQLAEGDKGDLVFLADKLAKADDANRMIKWFLEVRKNEKEFIITRGEETWKDRRQELMDKIVELGANLKGRFKLDLNIRQGNEAIAAITAYDAAFGRFSDGMGQQEVASQKMVIHARDAQQECEDLRANQKEKMERQITEADTVILIGTVVALLAAGLLAFVTTRAITGPLKVAVDTADRLSLGNTDIKIGAGSKDELGQLLTSMHTLANSWKKMARVADDIAGGDLSVKVVPLSSEDTLGNALGEMVQNLRQQTQEITEATDVLASSTSQITALAAQLVTSTTQATTAVGETTTTVGEVQQTSEASSEKAKQISEDFQKTTQISQTGEKATEDTINGMSLIKEQMGSIAESIVQLSEQSQTVGEIIATVDDIAEQSNVLAVNAAVEAARAGEQGKGFAVVAEEIKTLAEQSKRATSQVRTILSDIQKATNQAVMVTEQAGKVVDSGSDHTNKAAEAIRRLTDSVSESSQAATQIAASSRQQVVGMEQIAKAMESVKQASEQNLGGTKQLEGAAQKLDGVGRKLQEQVRRYNV